MTLHESFPGFESLEQTELLRTRAPLAEIHRTFLLSEISDGLDAMPLRFAQKHDPRQAFSRERFIEVLGIDVDHCTHPVRQWYVLTHMIDGASIDLRDDEVEALELAAIVHDYPEAVTELGDVAYADKTPAVEDEEAAIMPKLLTALYGREAGVYIHEIVAPVLDRQTKLGAIFYASEKFGYALTQLRAWHMAQAGSDFSADQYRTLYSVASEAPLHLPFLAERQKLYPSIQRFLDDSRTELLQMSRLPDVATIQSM